MSGSANDLKPEDAYKLLTCEVHLGTSNLDFQSEEYVFKPRADGTQLINIGYTWEKLLLAARAIAAVKNKADVCVVSGRPFAQRALLKFAAHTGATAIVGRFVPGSFTNQKQKQFKEPSLIIVSDPRLDHQAVKEASYVNIPVIAFTNTDSPLKFVDVAIPSNNKGVHAVGLMWWMLAREVLRLRGEISLVEEPTKLTREKNLDLTSFFTLNDKLIMPDLYFYRDPEEQKKQEEEAKKAKEEAEKKKAEQPEPIEPHKPIVMDDAGKNSGFNYVHVADWANPDGQGQVQQQQPNYDPQQQQNYEQSQPNYESQQPNYEQQHPNYEQQQPNYEQQNKREEPKEDGDGW